MSDENVEIDRNDTLKASIQHSTASMIQSSPATILGGLLEQ
jgi:hypothetical protein